MTEVMVKSEELEAFAMEVFRRAGMPAEAAATEAHVLVWANLRGVDSHGVLRIPYYLKSVEAGSYKVNPDIRVIKETPALVVVDADHSFGPVAGILAMERAMDKAAAVGIGWGAVRNTTHMGSMAYYTLMAAERDMIGVAVTTNPPNMAPFGAKAAGVHNSPLSIAVPAGACRPLCLDMATSVAAGGKLQLASDKGVSIPLGWALDANGEPTTDPNQGRILLPAGGYKGSSLALMFECLSSILVGVPLLAPHLSGTAAAAPGTNNGVVAAISVAAFTDVNEFKRNVDATVEGIKALPAAEGFGEVMVPGEPEDRVYAERLQKGVPLPEGTINNLRAVADTRGLAQPAWLAA